MATIWEPGYIIEHIEQLKILITGGISLAVYLVKQVLSKRLAATRIKGRMKKQLVYLEKYHKYLDEEDKKYLKSRVNDEIMKSVMGLSYQHNRKDLFYLYNRIEDGRVYQDIVTLNRSLCRNEQGHYYLAHRNSRVKCFLHYIFLFFLAVLTLICIFIGVTLLQEQKHLLAVISLILGIVFELACVWYFSYWVPDARVEEINALLAKLPPRDDT